MFPFPREPKKIAERIRRYENALRKEIQMHGTIDDGAGKRYLLGVLYLLKGDPAAALKSYAWLEEALPDDGGEPLDYLCWTLALYRSGDLESASKKLRQTMLQNLYLVPALIGEEQVRLDIWVGANWGENDYLQDAPAEYFALWDEAALGWARQTYQSPGMREARDRHIAILKQLKTEPVGPKRAKLVAELYQLGS